MDKVDVAIIGGGMMGSATAFFLLKHGFKGRVAIIEKDTTYGYSCTARAVGGIRQQFSCPENISLSRFGLDFIRNLKREFGPDAEVDFCERAYLLLASEGGLATLRANLAVQQSLGADVALLDREGLQSAFPWLNTSGLAGGTCSRSGEGWLDPNSLMTLLRKKAAQGGCEVVNDEVVAIGKTADFVSSVELRSGRQLKVGAVVNAAGAGAARVAAMAGVILPVGPRKRYVFVLDCPNADEALHRGPLLVDPSGFYLRPEGKLFLAGLSPLPGEEPQDLDWDVDYAWFDERIWPLLAERVPAFEAIKVINAWVGHYDYNAFDENGIIGKHPGIPNLYFANGFSGHGMQQGPATGNAIAELIVHGAYRTIDLSRMGYERILRQETYGETNII